MRDPPPPDIRWPFWSWIYCSQVPSTWETRIYSFFLLGWSCLLRLVNNINYMYYYLCWCTRYYIIYLVYTMQEYNIFLHTRITCLNFIIYNSIFKTKNSLGYCNENCLNRQNVFRRSFIFIKFLNKGLGSVWNSIYSHMNHFKEEI